MGPVAFTHRPSAQSDPLAPLGHHWQDATHIAFGVLTGGIFSRHWKLEGSWFNGREPDENRWDLDLRPFDSWATRLTLNPTQRLSIAGWYGFLESPEASHPDESTRRFGASVLFAHPGVAGYARDLVRTRSAALGAGFRASVNVIPASLGNVYGTTRPAGFAVYLRVRPPDVMTAR